MLKGYIDTGYFQVGDKIPSENELSEMLGVSRPSVKTALDRLKTMGFLDVRVGDGTYVKNCTAEDFLRNVSGQMLQPKDLPEILELRQAIEAESLRLAIERADEQDLAHLESACQRLLDSLSEKNAKQAARCDYEFHRELCRCSKNRYLLMLYEITGSLIQQQISLFVESYLRRPAAGEDAHTDLLRAVKDRDFPRGYRRLIEMFDLETHQIETQKGAN